MKNFSSVCFHKPFREKATFNDSSSEKNQISFPSLSVVAENPGGFNCLSEQSEDRLCKFYRYNGSCKRGKNW